MELAHGHVPFCIVDDPDHVEAIAAQLYMEMLEAGFSRVEEFHYLHHDKDGGAYANIAEMAERIGAASAITGIDLTLLPVFYAHSGFGGAAPRMVKDALSIRRRVLRSYPVPGSASRRTAFEPSPRNSSANSSR